MDSLRTSIFVAQSTNRVIGRDGDLPWRLSNDLRYFKRLTMGHAIVMGRKTLDSIGRILPGRKTIVLTRDKTYAFEGAEVVHSWPAAIAAATEYEQARIAGDANAEQSTTDSPPVAEVFVVGGAQIYAMALPHTDRIYLTQVDATIDGDTHFPSIEQSEWKTVSEESHPADEKNDHAHTFFVFDRLNFPNRRQFDQ